MTNKMLIDATHLEEIRVAIVNEENRIEDFEVETTGKEQVKGNIYAAEIMRVEPSLQAAFVDYGGNRNGFLAFNEIHPSWFDVSDEEKAELIQELEDIAERRRKRFSDDDDKQEKVSKNKEDKNKDKDKKPEETAEQDASDENEIPKSLDGLTPQEMEEDAIALAKASSRADDEEGSAFSSAINFFQKLRPKRHNASKDEDNDNQSTSEETKANSKNNDKNDNLDNNSEATENKKEEKPQRKEAIHRRYSIKDVVKEGQKILIQVNKEERGNKGAAISTYISLPGRFIVLMPNTPYAGGVSRKITNFAERKELKKAIEELKLHSSMGIIVRTAGVGQDPKNIKRDAKNLVKHWEKIQKDFKNTKTKNACVHEDGSLIIRAVRDMMSDEISEISIAGKRAYNTVRDYIKLIMPEYVKIVKEHKEATPVFTKNGVEMELNRLHRTRVDLPSGGYLIINPTEALVSVDVNSGRATQEKNIEETAYKTNLEAATEVARQLRLRDLAGLVVIDFIDMEDRRNERNVEKTMRKAIRRDRARVQIAPISPFGLLEMSRQRLRPSLGESTSIACPHCNGTGMSQSLSTAALMVLRCLEEDEIHNKADRVIVTTSHELAVYILNHKRDLLRDMEDRYKFQVLIRSEDKYIAPDHRIELIRIDSKGTEKSETIEMTLRDTAEVEEYKGNRKGRRNKPNNKGRKPATNNNNNNNDKAKVAEKNTKDDTKAKKEPQNNRHPRKNNNEDATKDFSSNSNKAKDNADNKNDPKPEVKVEKEVKAEVTANKKPSRGRRSRTPKPAKIEANTTDNSSNNNVSETSPSTKDEANKQSVNSNDKAESANKSSTGTVKIAGGKTRRLRRVRTAPTASKVLSNDNKSETIASDAKKDKQQENKNSDKAEAKSEVVNITKNTSEPEKKKPRRARTKNKI